MELIDERRSTTSSREAAGDDAITRATGRSRADWFSILDEWGAIGRPFREVAGWLTGQHGMSDWWAQKVIVEYEQARGARAPGVRRDGTFEISATKVVGVPVARLFEAFADETHRSRWLRGIELTERSSERDRRLRFDWAGGPTTITATFTSLGDARSQVAVAHGRLPDHGTADRQKAFWRQHLGDLKVLLEQHQHAPAEA